MNSYLSNIGKPLAAQPPFSEAERLVRQASASGFGWQARSAYDPENLIRTPDGLWRFPTYSERLLMLGFRELERAADADPLTRGQNLTEEAI